MAIFEGSVSVKAGTNGVPTLKADASGKWNSDNVVELCSAAVDAGLALSTYSVWVDKPDHKRPAKSYSAKQLQAFMVSATEIQLVAVRRRTRTGITFRVPVIRFGFTETKAKATKSSSVLL